MWFRVSVVPSDPSFSLQNMIAHVTMSVSCLKWIRQPLQSQRVSSYRPQSVSARSEHRAGQLARLNMQISSVIFNWHCFGLPMYIETRNSTLTTLMPGTSPPLSRLQAAHGTFGSSQTIPWWVLGPKHNVHQWYLVTHCFMQGMFP